MAKNGKNIMSFKKLILLIAVALLGGIVGGLISSYVIFTKQETANDRIKNFYEDEIATLVSPTTLRKMIDQKDKSYLLVDLRSKAEYDKEHIITAINIPAVSLNADQIVSAFKKLPKDKQIIVHCYSMACTLGRQIGKLLSENGIYVKELDVGWSEWKYYWSLWNPGEDPAKGKDYVVSSKSSGTSNGTSLPPPCVNGEFGC